jgi:hypothetical protein
MSPRRYNKGTATPQAGPQPIPGGKYLMEVVSVKFGKSKSSGHDMVTAQASPVEGEFKGRKVPFYVTLPPLGHKTWGSTLHFLKTIGEPWEAEDIDVDENSWIHKRFWGVVDTEMYNGEPMNKIRKFIPIDESQPIAAAQEEVPF